MFDIESSGTVEIFNLAKKIEAEGKKLIHLEVGELDFPTPEYIKQATIDAIADDKTVYTETKGIIGLRNEIVEYIQNRYKIKGISALKNILVTPGAKFGLFSSLLSLLTANDEIIVFSPSFPTFRAIPKAMKIAVKEVPILRGSDIIPMEEILKDLKAKLNEHSRIFILNGPCNPTGQVISQSTLKNIWEVCKKFPRLLFLVDDIYEQFIYPPASFVTPIEFDPALERIILINGFSKSFCMTGYRLGYIVAHEKVIDSLVKFQSNSVTCATSFAQFAGEIALKHLNQNKEDYLKFKKHITEELEARRSFIYEKLSKIKGIKCNKPEGAFYIFPDISELRIKSYEFCMKLIQYGVVTTPGVSFGEGGEYHFRICYSRPMEELKIALEKIRLLCEELSHK